MSNAQALDLRYFVMDYVPGGDLLSLLIKAGRVPEHAARFYMAELIMAIASIHTLGYRIYTRDY